MFELNQAFYFDDPKQVADPNKVRYTVGIAIRGDLIEEYKQLLTPKGYTVLKFPSTIVVKNQIPYVSYLTHIIKHNRYKSMVHLIFKLRVDIYSLGGCFEIYDRCSFMQGGKVEMHLTFGENSHKYRFSKLNAPARKD